MTNKEIQNKLEEIFNIVREISAKGDDIDRIYTVKHMLRNTYAALNDEGVKSETPDNKRRGED